MAALCEFRETCLAQADELERLRRLEAAVLARIEAQEIFDGLPASDTTGEAYLHWRWKIVVAKEREDDAIAEARAEASKKKRGLDRRFGGCGDVE